MVYIIHSQSQFSHDSKFANTVMRTMPRVISEKRTPELPAGYTHVGQLLEDWRKDTDLKPREVEEATAAISEDRKVERSYISKLETGSRTPHQLSMKRLEALRVVYKIDREFFERSLGVVIPRGAQLEPVSFNATAPRLSTAMMAAQVNARSEALADMMPVLGKPVYASGSGPSFLDEEPEGEIGIPQTYLERYPNLMVQRIHGTSMEPDFPNGHYALVVPDMALATSTSAVCVWLSDNGRVIKYLGEAREDGDHVLYQTNPPTGERNVLVAPVGSIILGVVVDVIRGGVPRRSAREIWHAMEKQLPDLLDED
jgi:Peptidase S24-like